MLYSSIQGQGNCQIYPLESGERMACELSYRAIEYEQGSKESQYLFDQAIQIGPKYAYAYYQKSVPYFKRARYAEGLTLINKAIELEPANYLFYRAYWYFYNYNFQACIQDLESLYQVHQAHYVTTPGGELEMRLLLAMAYALEGSVDKGIHIIEQLMVLYEQEANLKGLYDHYCLGLLYFQKKDYVQAYQHFERQLSYDEKFADNYFYLGRIHQAQGNIDQARKYYQASLERKKGKHGGYNRAIFATYNISTFDIEEQLKNL